MAPSLKKELHEYTCEYNALKRFKQAIIKRIHDPNDTDSYNFGFNEMDPESHDLCDLIEDCGTDYDSDLTWVGLNVIGAAHWDMILADHFRPTKERIKYQNSILFGGPEYFYDKRAKLGDKPITHKGMVKRINKYLKFSKKNNIDNIKSQLKSEKSKA